MLQHYSAYKVAETFNLLSTLAPGRVDLGVGKAPGGFPLSTAALQAGSDPALKPAFEKQIDDLNAYLSDELDGGASVCHAASAVAAERGYFDPNLKPGTLRDHLGLPFRESRYAGADAVSVDKAVGA